MDNYNLIYEDSTGLEEKPSLPLMHGNLIPFKTK